MIGLTSKQLRCKQAILSFKAENGVYPSRYELMEICKFGSTGEVQRVLLRLSERGHMIVLPDVDRGLIPIVYPTEAGGFA